MYSINVFNGISENKDNNKVPIDDFLSVIAKETGWNKNDFLYKKDIGDLEREINVHAQKPTQTNSTKLGKSTNQLYRFVCGEERNDIIEAVDKAIKN